MDLVLTRNQFIESGIFGKLEDKKGNHVTFTLEHSYSNVPKMPPGNYTCVKGTHKLAHMEHSFETFEITGVPGHTNILFHEGNWNDDSEGCVLLGSAIGPMLNGGRMLTKSKDAFEKFMDLQSGVASFSLTVEDNDGVI